MNEFCNYDIPTGLIALEETYLITNDHNNHHEIEHKPFYFIRHGQTDWSAELIALGPIDYPLNDRGRAEAMEAAAYVKSEMPIDAKPIIIASTMLRTRQTAAIISDHCSIPISFEDRLQERYYGDARIGASDAESDSIFAERVQTVFEHINVLTEAPDQYVIVVSHAGVFQQMTQILSVTKEPIVTGGCVVLCSEKSISKEDDSKEERSSTYQSRLLNERATTRADIWL
jgi:probable phosphoglycerate mutase